MSQPRGAAARASRRPGDSVKGPPLPEYNQEEYEQMTEAVGSPG